MSKSKREVLQCLTYWLFNKWGTLRMCSYYREDLRKKVGETRDIVVCEMD